MSKETINITLDHFKPKSASDYGWRNNSQEYLKLHFTVEVLDKDGNEIVNKKFRGCGPYPYKNNVDFSYGIDDGLKTFLIEEVRSSTTQPLFEKVIKSLLDSLKQACNDAEIEYWDGSWSELFDKKPIAEIPLNEIEVQNYLPKYQKKIIKLILKDKSLLKDKEVGERVIKIDAKAGYSWVESGAITKDEYFEIINKNANRVFTKAETEFLADKGPYIKCTNDNIKQIVKEQIELLGNEADLNHLDVSNVTNMSGMFYMSQFNGDISSWDVSSVTDMENMFAISKFNGDISNWDVSDVKIMRSMFSRSQFNEDISGWDVSNVTDMYGMFDNSQFNGDISKWDVSNVTDMGSMFSDSQFNGDISKWDVSNVTNMNIMFYKSQFNGDISKWDVSNVKKMNSMFYKSQFNGDISNWDVSNVTDTRGIFEDCPISEENKPKITFNYKDVLNEYELNRIKSDYSIEEIMVFEKNAEKLTADLNASVVMYEWEYIDTHFSKGFCPLSYLFLEENNMILSSENDENLGFLERKDIPDWIVLRFLRKLSSASDSDRNKSYVYSISHLIKNAKYTDKSIAANIGSILMLASDLWSDRTSWEDAWEVVKEFSDLCVLDDDAQASIEQWVETYQ